MGLKETFSWKSFLTLSVPGYSTLTFGFFNFLLTSRPRRQCTDTWCQRGSQRNKSLSVYFVYWCFGLDGRKKLHNPKRQYTNVFALFKQGLSLIGEKILVVYSDWSIQFMESMSHSDWLDGTWWNGEAGKHVQSWKSKMSKTSKKHQCTDAWYQKGWRVQTFKNQC